MTVNVTERQFAFEFSYPQANGKTIVSPQLYLAKDQPYVFKLRSLDVIHSFFVPEFSEKLDAVPGITTTLRVTPTRLGDYPAECTELCGAGHALMRAPVHVVTPAAFRQWLQSQPAITPPPIGTPPPNANQPGVPTGAGAPAPSSSSGSSSSAGGSSTLHLERGHQPGGRQGGVHEPVGGMQRLPYPRRCRNDGHYRPQPRDGARPRRQESGDGAEAVPDGIDREAERLHLPRLPAEHHAPDFLPAAVAYPDPGPGQLHCERDQMRGSLWAGAGLTHRMNVILEGKELR